MENESLKVLKNKKTRYSQNNYLSFMRWRKREVVLFYFFWFSFVFSFISLQEIRCENFIKLSVNLCLYWIIKKLVHTSFVIEINTVNHSLADTSGQEKSSYWCDCLIGDGSTKSKWVESIFSGTFMPSQILLKSEKHAQAIMNSPLPLWCVKKQIFSKSKYAQLCLYS